MKSSKLTLHNPMSIHGKNRWLLVALLGLVLAVVHQVANATAPKVLAVLMYADWCKSCEVLDPKLKAVQTEFQQGNILFVRFDLTNERTSHQSKLLAQSLGLTEIYEKNAGKTGYLALIDRASGQQFEKVTKAHSEQEIRTLLRGASTR